MKISTLLAASITAFAMALPAAGEVKIALDSPPDLEKSGTYVWAHTFSEHLRESGLDAEEYERNSLGEEADRLDQISTGLLEVSMSDAKSAGQLDSTIYGALLPFFFEDTQQLDASLANGMLEKINEGTLPHRVRVLDLVHLGQPAGIFTTKTPIRSFDDFSNVRMRALDELQIQVFNAWGAKSTIVSWSEVPNALQTGVADGYVNPPAVPLVYGHTSFIKYFTDVKSTPSIRIAIASEDWYEGLSEEERAIVDSGVIAARKANREFVERGKMVFGLLEGAGIEVIQLAPEERAKFQAASQPLYNHVGLPEGALEAWQASIQ